VLIPWIPFFDPYNSQITKVVQWVKIPRLPGEFWETDHLCEILQHVDQVVRIDQNTLLRLKGKFAGVCVNIDITKPLPGSLTVNKVDGCLRVPIIYEGLHEVCPLCGAKSHQLQYCPKMTIAKKVEVLVEKFDATGVTKLKPLNVPNSTLPSFNDSWVTVSPKKRVKAMIQAKPKCNSGLKPKGEPVADKNSQPLSSNAMSFTTPAPLGPNDIILANSLVMHPGKVQSVADDLAEDPLDALRMGEDDEVNMEVYLNLQIIEDMEMSIDSAKRKRTEDGDEASSKVLP